MIYVGLDVSGKTIGPMQSRNGSGLTERSVEDAKLAAFETDSQVKWMKEIL